MKTAAQGRKRPLQHFFQAVPPSYDRINRLLTFRMDEYWRQQAAGRLMQGDNTRMLDLCTGTGDLAIHLQKKAKADTEIYALDYSEPMLERARRKAARLPDQNIRFISGDAANMPFEDGFFDAVGIAFAFRNLTYKNPDSDIFLGEILRVLRPGGQFVAVETSQPGNPLIRSIFHAYMRFITGPAGGWLSGQQAAYKYLAHSAVQYYTAPQLQKVLLDAGFSRVSYQLFFNGIAALWDCRK
ncbi:MAG: ubiquinone/menaquinone biosynthesis methyltransferase [Bacteroidales bacterium]